jgi:hypothetical protein
MALRGFLRIGGIPLSAADRGDEWLSPGMASGHALALRGVDRRREKCLPRAVEALR